MKGKLLEWGVDQQGKPIGKDDVFLSQQDWEKQEAMRTGCVALKTDPAIVPFSLNELKIRLAPTRTGSDLEGAWSAQFETAFHEPTSAPYSGTKLEVQG